MVWYVNFRQCFLKGGKYVLRGKLIYYCPILFCFFRSPCYRSELLSVPKQRRNIHAASSSKRGATFTPLFRPRWMIDAPVYSHRSKHAHHTNTNTHARTNKPTTHKQTKHARKNKPGNPRRGQGTRGPRGAGAPEARAQSTSNKTIGKSGSIQ